MRASGVDGHAEGRSVARVRSDGRSHEREATRDEGEQTTCDEDARLMKTVDDGPSHVKNKGAAMGGGWMKKLDPR